MIKQKSTNLPVESQPEQLRLGTISYVAIFLGLIFGVMLAPADRLWMFAIVYLIVAGIVFPISLKRILRLKMLILWIIFIVPPIFFLGEIDRSIWGIGYSSEGALASLQFAIRLLVVLVTVNGFTAAIDIVSVAGMMERFGMQGLGFSLGVALNLLPTLQQSSLNTWHSLRMRGGLRHQRWRGLQLFIITVMTNTLRRAEEIALAAEGRGFSPEHSRPLPMKKGTWDQFVIIGAILSIICAIII
ncbi:MAG: energy-coupling factor transporter transmembrane protein EcfT [Anaerolineales bacterium]|nr:energy-coupling factor transporter transmembrane protein EcfT [Anaerolineales bacterium]